MLSSPAEPAHAADRVQLQSRLVETGGDHLQDAPLDIAPVEAALCARALPAGPCDLHSNNLPIAGRLWLEAIIGRKAGSMLLA